MRVLSTAEVWRAVPGYEDLYEVSDQGRVRSLDRLVKYADGRLRLHTGKLIAPGFDRKRGYQSVNLWRKNRVQQIKVQRLVALAFLGDAGDGMHAAHDNYIRDHNAATNLKWLSAEDNARRRLAAGRGRQKITRPTALNIRRRYQAGERQCDLVREFQLSRAQISAICRGRSWAW